MRTDRIGEDLGDGMVFRSASGDVTYGEAVAIDATGDRVRAETVLANGTITITVPADFVARAALPLLVDPTVAASLAVPTGAVSAGLPESFRMQIWATGWSCPRILYATRPMPTSSRSA